MVGSEAAGTASAAVPVASSAFTFTFAFAFAFALSLRPDLANGEENEVDFGAPFTVNGPSAAGPAG